MGPRGLGARRGGDWPFTDRRLSSGSERIAALHSDSRVRASGESVSAVRAAEIGRNGQASRQSDGDCHLRLECNPIEHLIIDLDLIRHFKRYDDREIGRRVTVVCFALHI